MSRIEKYNVPSWPVRKKKNKTISKSYTIITRCMEKKIILLVTEMMPMFGYENHAGQREISNS